ncbi:MAG: hypothetical protein EB088_12705 [Betaproteobacteria bacterium]|nr:hypothetical protein [Betaproteobacteria bacterium]
MLERDIFIWTPYHSLLALVCMVSFGLSRVIVATQRWHGRWSLDGVEGVQKSHARPTPRIGGLAIAAAMVLAWCILEFGPRQWLDSAAQKLTMHTSASRLW